MKKEMKSLVFALSLVSLLSVSVYNIAENLMTGSAAYASETSVEADYPDDYYVEYHIVREISGGMIKAELLNAMGEGVLISEDDLPLYPSHEAQLKVGDIIEVVWDNEDAEEEIWDNMKDVRKIGR
ncbi:MAG TPA: hypothetical protein VK190_05000 [Pseudoneobacillus sp.]|nr:hypothetical protein [Pseudoneobacillus sp.]